MSEGTLVGEMGESFLRNVLGNDTYEAVADDAPTTAADPAASATKPSAPDHSTQAERELAVEADKAAAAEAGRYRSNQLDQGEALGASLTGTTYGQIGNGGGYQLDPEQLASQITEWEDIRYEMREIHRGLRNAARAIYSPTDDGPATSQAASAQRSILKGADDYESQIKYLDGLIKSLRKAHGSYVEEDDETQHAFSKSDSDGASDGTGSLFDKKGGK